jgi:hypothetical protein
MRPEEKDRYQRGSRGLAVRLRLNAAAMFVHCGETAT